MHAAHAVHHPNWAGKAQARLAWVTCRPAAATAPSSDGAKRRQAAPRPRQPEPGQGLSPARPSDRGSRVFDPQQSPLAEPRAEPLRKAAVVQSMRYLRAVGVKVAALQFSARGTGLRPKQKDRRSPLGVPCGVPCGVPWGVPDGVPLRGPRGEPNCGLHSEPANAIKERLNAGGQGLGLWDGDGEAPDAAHSLTSPMEQRSAPNEF